MAAQKDTANKSTKGSTEPGQYLGLFSRVYTQGSWYIWYWSTHRTRHCLQCNHWWCSGYTLSMCIFKCFCTHSQGIFFLFCGFTVKSSVLFPAEVMNCEKSSGLGFLSFELRHQPFVLSCRYWPQKRDEIQLKWRWFTKIGGHYKWYRLSKPTFISIHKDILQTSVWKFHIVTPSFLQYFC